MNSSHIDTCFRRIRRVSQAVRLFCKLAYCVILFLLFGLTGHIMYHPELGGAPEHSSFVTYALPRLTILYAPMGLVLLLIWLIDQLFACFERGEIFERITLRRFRVLSWIILFSSLVKINFDLASGTVSLDFFSGLPWVGLLLVFISWILEIGAEIQEENKATI